MKHLRVLISAYACEPGKGSEPEVGWQWAIQMARFHDVWVLTRSNNRAAIESWIGHQPARARIPRFIYHDGSDFLLRLKRRFGWTRPYYIWWQRSARPLVRKLCREHSIDLLHHVTIAAYRYPAAIWGHGLPCVWGPVGGMETVPWRLLPFRHPRVLPAELARNIVNFLQGLPGSGFIRRARRSSITVVSTGETKLALDRRGVKSVLMPAIGLDMDEFPARSFSEATPRPLRLLYVGHLQWLKGCDLALHAMAASRTDAELHIIGTGPFRSNLESLIHRLGLTERVTFSPRIPREQVLAEYQMHDVFVFPSLHDSGGFAVLEAMASGLPVICVDIGGPSISVRSETGFRVAPTNRKSIIRAMANHIAEYSSNRLLMERHGKNARESVAAHFDWNRKSEIMNKIYHQAIQTSANGKRGQLH